MRFDFSKIDPLTGLPPVIEREEDKIQLMTRRPAKSGFIRLLQNRVNLRSVGNLHYSERLYYDVRTKSLYTARGFQFHKGTIKTPKSLSCIPFACISIP